MTHKLFRDPLYDYIYIEKKHSWLVDLINVPEVQRLRHISQLGMSHITYPGANHSRFSHSLGVLHLMQQCVSHLKQGYSTRFKQLDEEALLAAALLHDVGHAPFSHATEEIFGNHEERTLGILNRQTSDIYKVLHKQAKTLPGRVAALIAKRSTAPLWQEIAYFQSVRRGPLRLYKAGLFVFWSGVRELRLVQNFAHHGIEREEDQGQTGGNICHLAE
jgi:HD superfamily phosphohydrolase